MVLAELLDFQTTTGKDTFRSGRSGPESGDSGSYKSLLNPFINKSDQTWLIFQCQDIRSEAWFQLTLPCHNFRKQTEFYAYILIGLSQKSKKSRKKEINALHISGIISQSANEDLGKWKLPTFFIPLKKK